MSNEPQKPKKRPLRPSEIYGLRDQGIEPPGEIKIEIIERRGTATAQSRHTGTSCDADGTNGAAKGEH